MKNNVGRNPLRLGELSSTVSERLPEIHWDIGGQGRFGLSFTHLLLLILAERNGALTAQQRPAFLL